MKLKVLNHKRKNISIDGGTMLEPKLDEFYIDNAMGGHCSVCCKKKVKPMLEYEPEDGYYSASICLTCLSDILKQMEILNE